MTMPPDLSSRPLQVTVERTMTASADTLFRAWTENFDQWFAAPGTLLMNPKVDAPFFFETHFEGQRHPHYGRFLRLIPGKLVELTWITGNPGTKGAETVVSVELSQLKSGTHVKLVHAGFPDEESKDAHAEGWTMALEILDNRMNN